MSELLQHLDPVPAAAFEDIVIELGRRPIAVNNYRVRSGIGRSQCFGLVNKRCLAPDLSRQCFQRPYLYHLLCEYAEKYVPIEWDGVTVNMNYPCAAHTDKGNIGMSYIVAFGDYWRGRLKIHDHADLSGSLIDIKMKPLLFNGSVLTHSVEITQGPRFSLVYYRLKRHNPETQDVKRKDYFAAIDADSNQWRIFRKDLDGVPRLLQGLPHPLKGRKKSKAAVDAAVVGADATTIVVSASQETPVEV